MNVEERLAALRDDARWNPIRLYPEHGRMPAPVRPARRRAVLATAVAVAVVAAVFGGISLARGLTSQPAPVPAAATGSAVAEPPVFTQEAAIARARVWLAGAVLPAGSVKSDAPPAGAPGIATAPVSWCFDGASGVFTYWTVPDMTAAQVSDFLVRHPSAGMSFARTAAPTGPDLAEHPATQLVIEQKSESSRDGMMFTIASVGTNAVVRGEATVAIGDPSGVDCPSSPPTATSQATAAPARAAAAARAREEAAAEARAHGWLVGALLPAASVRSVDAPAGAPGAPVDPPGWCAPQYRGEIVYWTVPGMSASEVRDWLAAHLSPGMSAKSVTWPAGSDLPVSGTDQVVVEQPAVSSVEGLIFTIASVGPNAVVRVEAKAAIGAPTC